MYTTRVPDNQRTVGSVAARLARVGTARPVETVSDAPKQTDLDAETVRHPEVGPVKVQSDEPTAAQMPVFNVWRAIGWIWSGRLFIALCLIAGLAGAFVISRGLPPRFTSYADLIIAPPSAPVTPDSFTATSPQRDTQLLEFDSRLRMMTSTNVLERTVEALALYDDPEFTGPSGFSLPFLGPGPEERAVQDKLAAMRSLYEKVSAHRDGQTYVATLAVYSQDPDKSVRIANAIVAAFQEELWEAERITANQAVEALGERLSVLRERVSEAESAVEDFRRESGLQGGGEGQLLASRSLDQVNTQINDARAALIAAESRHAELVAARSSVLAQNGIWDSEAIAALRGEYNELRRELDAQSAIYGARHPNITSLQPQLQTLEAALNAEVERLIRAAAADVEQARSVVDRLTARADTTRAILSVDESALIKLRELQREADVRATIYESYLRRMGELSEQSQVEVTTIRVISPPLPAPNRSWPPRLVVLLAIGGLAGLLAGMVVALGVGAARTYLPVLRGRLAQFSSQR